MVKVSVVIPVYKVEKYLRECVDSVLAQSCTELEVILVDDGSPDRCGQICDEYAAADKRVSVIHKQNGGLSDARNAGLERATGKYVLFVDSDDMIANNAVEKLLAAAEKNDAQIVYFSAQTLYEDFEHAECRDDFVRKHRYPDATGAKTLLTMLENKEYIPCVQLQLYKTRMLADNALTFRKGMLHEDELFTVQAALCANQTTVINEKLYVRRQRAGSIMSGMYTLRSFEGAYCCIRYFIHILNSYPKGSDEWRMLIYDLALLMNLLTVKYVMMPADDRKAAKEKFKVLRNWYKRNGYLGDKKLKLKMRALPMLKAYKMFKRKQLTQNVS